MLLALKIGVGFCEGSQTTTNLGLKQNFETTLSTEKETISSAMNLMESSILAQNERWQHV